MRKYAFAFLLPLVLLSGCATFKTEFRNQHGVALDRPYGEQRAVVVTAFYQRYDGFVAIGIDGGTANEVAYGDSVEVKMGSKKYFNYEIVWDRIEGNDSHLETVRHRRSGLYSGRPIIIDEAFLLEVDWIEVVVTNNSPETTSYNDSQDNRFVLPPFESIVLKVVTGDYKLNWRPFAGYTGEGLAVCKVLTTGKKVFWGGKFYEDHLTNNRSTPNWEDLEQMRRYGCIRR